MIAEGDISNLAGRVPLGPTQEPREPKSTVQARVRGRRWAPFWAMCFVFGAGLLSWGAIAACVVIFSR